MKQFRTIMVAAALDSRDPVTLAHAARFARAAHPDALYVTHVLPTFDFPEEMPDEVRGPLTPVDEEARHSLSQLLEAHKHLFPPETRIESVVREGALISELLRVAAQKSADLLCLGRTQDDRDDEMSEEAVTLLRKAPCSTFITSPTATAEYERVLVPIDFSDPSREALTVAFAVAETTPGANVTILHAYSVPLGWHKSGRSYEEFAAIMKGHAERRWNEWLPGLLSRGVPWQVRFELSDNVPKTILSVAEELDSHLIAVGSHGRTRPAAALLGHVADKVASRTRRPLLCVKQKGHVTHLLQALLEILDLA